MIGNHEITLKDFHWNAGEVAEFDSRYGLGVFLQGKFLKTLGIEYYDSYNRIIIMQI